MIFTDTHAHSTFSSDTVCTIPQAVEAAIAAKLAGISFTDHLDVGVPEGSVGDHFDIANQQAVIKENQQKYGSQIALYAGIEIGLQTHYLTDIQKAIAAHRFDIVIGSVHLINGEDPYVGDFYVGRNLREAYREYLEYYIECIRPFDDFDVLGHYDYISRWSPYKEKTLAYRAFKDQFDTLFRIVIEKGKAIELNTRSFLSRDNQPGPQFDPDVFKRYRELGGELVTLGSDAHDTQRIGADFTFYAAKLKECGFNYLTHFKERKPQLTPNKL